MLGNVSLRRWACAAIGGAWVISPFACAHGLEVGFDPSNGEGGSMSGPGGNPGMTGGSAGMATGTGVAGGGSTVTRGSTGEGGSNGGASGSGGVGGGVEGAGGGLGGTSGVDAGGSVGGGGGVADAGRAGAGMGGASGTGGNDSGNSGGGAAGGKQDAGAGGGPSCPVGVAVNGLNATFGHGSRDPTDILYTDICPQEQVVIGYTGFVDTRIPASIGRIQTLCGSLSVSAAGGCQVMVSAGSTLPLRGTIGTAVFTQACPANQIVVGFQGRSSLVLDQVGFTCAPLLISRADAGYGLSLGPIIALPRAGGTGGTAFTEPCPIGQIARGTNVTNLSGIVGAFGLICGTPSLR